MTEISFYHLTTTPLERALPKILEKALEGGFRAVVKTKDEVTLDRLNTALWTYDPNSFLPHGSSKEKFAEDQPVYLSETEENPNGAKLLVITDGTTPQDINAYDRILDMFDGANDTSVAAARTRWKTYKDQGVALTYLQQTDSGGWQKKA